jgi:hypothetical protein
MIVEATDFSPSRQLTPRCFWRKGPVGCIARRVIEA